MMLKKMRLVLFLSLACSFNAQADFKQFIFNQEQEQAPLPESLVFSVQSPVMAVKKLFETDLFKQRLDHFVETSARFDQEYYFSDEFAQNSNSPVLFYICGEAKCSSSRVERSLKYAAEKMNAFMVGLEHRFYGQTQPFEYLTTENLKTLTVEQALLDLSEFQEFMKQKHGLTGKWYSVGGSYPGALSAFYRTAYPQNVVGAWASSAPVMAKESFEEYDLHVARVAGVSCAESIRKVNLQVDRAFASGNAELANHYRELFDATDVVRDDDFLYAVADTAAFAIQYGMRDAFCNALMVSPESRLVEAYADFAQTQIYSRFGFRPVSMTPQGSESNLAQDHSDSIGMRQWFYQSCTEFGFWQVAYHDASLSTRSPRINLDYHNQICSRLFGIQTPVNVEKINSKYYQPLLDGKASRVYFTNGAQDPWSTLSITVAPAASNQIYTQLIEGAAHCDDLRSGNVAAPVSRAREAVVQQLQGW